MPFLLDVAFVSLPHSPKKLLVLFVPFDGVDGPALFFRISPGIIAEQIARRAQNERILNLNLVHLKLPSVF